MSVRSPGDRSGLPPISWKEGTRRGSFESFYAAFGSLSRAALAEKLRSPVLVSAVSTDPSTWSSALVLVIEPRPTTAQIVIVADEASGDLEAGAGRIYVGRTGDADVVIAAPTVSKRHAFFTKRETGWEITDAGSANGTILEGETLRPNRRERIRRPLATLEFGPDARFVFMTPESVIDLFEEIRRSRGEVVASPPRAPFKEHAADFADFEALTRPLDAPASASPVEPAEAAPAEEEAPAPAPARREPKPASPKPRSTWQAKRPESLEEVSDALSKSTDRIPVAVGKTPQDLEDLNFEYALRAIGSLGPLVHSVVVVLKVGDQSVALLGPGGSQFRADTPPPSSAEAVQTCLDALVRMRPLVRAIRMELIVGDRKPVEIFRIKG
jgi:pSer/pThr/pTyr-binding forkhead associated (FHA) protein